MILHPFWRTIITDSESPDGIAPICPTHPLDRDLVTDCCPDPKIEVHDPILAGHIVTLLNDASSEHFVNLKDCSSLIPSSPHCAHYIDGDSECHWCRRPKWLPEGGL